MSRRVMPYLVVNYGCEMLFVLNQRLEAQLIEPTKSDRIKEDVIASMFSAAFMDEVFRPQDVYTNAALRKVFATVSDSSIMRLNESSMRKLYDLMTMTVKHQVLTLHHPYELPEYTLNHLLEMKKIAPCSSHACIDSVIARMARFASSLSVYDLAVIRNAILNFSLDRRVKVSLFLERRVQFSDGNMKLDRAKFLPPIAAVEPPGSILFYGATAEPVCVSFVHEDAGLVKPADIPVGHWGPANLSVDSPRMTANGYNVYRAQTGASGMAAQGIPLRSTTPSLDDQQPTAQQLQAYHHEMSYLAQLAGAHGASNEKFKLSLFEDHDDTDYDPAVDALGPESAPPPASTVSTAVTHPVPVAHPSTSGVSPAAEPDAASTMVKVIKMPAGAVRQENQQLLGIIDGFADAKASDGTSAGKRESDGGDNLLDLMDDI